MGEGFSWTDFGPHFPKTIGKPHWIDDRKTCVLPVELKPNLDYKLGLNSRWHNDFESASGVSLEPVEYSFTTRRAAAEKGSAGSP
jgi:hypothetical protein